MKFNQRLLIALAVAAFATGTIHPSKERSRFDALVAKADLGTITDQEKNEANQYIQKLTTTKSTTQGHKAQKRFNLALARGAQRSRTRSGGQGGQLVPYTGGQVVPVAGPGGMTPSATSGSGTMPAAQANNLSNLLDEADNLISNASNDKNEITRVGLAIIIEIERMIKAGETTATKQSITADFKDEGITLNKLKLGTEAAKHPTAEAAREWLSDVAMVGDYVLQQSASSSSSATVLTPSAPAMDIKHGLETDDAPPAYHEFM